jgi:TatD DNase family protein
MLVDSHCHLDFEVFDDDRAAVIDRAVAAGVGAAVTICTRLTNFAEVRALAESSPRLYCSVGIHPHQVAEQGVADTDRLIALADHPKVVGIGETGLDYFYDKSPRDAQAAGFRAHIRAARATGLPLIVHTRDADDDTAAIITEEFADGPFPGVLHCFTAGRRLAEVALGLGFYISLSGIVTFRNSDALRAIARDIPMDRLLVETDAPFLAPIPNRGKRNEPAFVVHTAAAVAKLKGLEIQEFSEATTRNFQSLFKKAVLPAP